MKTDCNKQNLKKADLKKKMDSTMEATAWKKKAMAFVTRSHRHLWGKNNEDPLAYLFTRGLKNDFCKQLYLGWNKFGQQRPFKTWGIESCIGQPEKFLLPPGIVIPYIIDKNLTSVFIHTLNEQSSDQLTPVPGSSSASIILGKIKETVVIIEDLFDGLFLFQEAGQVCSVLIHPDLRLPFDLNGQSILDQASVIHILLKKDANLTKENRSEESRTNIEKIFPELKKKSVRFYESQHDLAIFKLSL